MLVVSEYAEYTMLVQTDQRDSHSFGATENGHKIEMLPRMETILHTSSIGGNCV